MGLFSTRKASAREHSSPSQELPGSAQGGTASSKNLSRLATLFSEAKEEGNRETGLGQNEPDKTIPTIDIRDIDGSEAVPTDTVTPIAANQFDDDDRSFASQDRKPNVRPQHASSAAKAQQATGLQEIAVQRAESLSRIARRNSIKRSVSRKIARSESRRQLLKIRDGSLSEDKGNPALPRRMTSLTTSADFEKEEISFTDLNRSLSAQSERKRIVRGSLSPVPGIGKESLDERLGGVSIPRSGRSETTSLSSADAKLALAAEDMDSVTLNEDIDEDLDLGCASLRGFERSAEAVASRSRSRKGAPPSTTSGNSTRRREASSSRERKEGKQRKRPPPLLGSDDGKSAPNSAMDWPSGGCFGSDGGFMTGGFKITTEGMVGKPPGMKREDSDSDAETDVPQSSQNSLIVKSLKELQPGPTIGAGAGGRVYLAQHLPSKRTMAMKVVNVYNKEKRNQLLKELETLSTHVSRYLVRFYGAFYDGSGAVHITLEYMDHGCLSTFVQRVGAIPEKIVQIIALDCLKGLKFLHRHHVLHRDFKTANILLSRKLCCAKLSDFGLARDLNPGVSKVDTFVGTVAYMSPERLQGSKYTYASDIWALGVCIVECLLGRYPFDRPQNYFDYIEATITANMLQGLEQKGARFSCEVKDFISLCTMTDPMRRPASNQLLEHPWLKDVRRDPALFGSWLDECRILSMLPGAAAGNR